jgi:hypothetical protein
LILIEEDGDLGFGLWVLVFGLWVLDFGLWCLVFGLWVVGFGNWALGIGNLKEEYSKEADWQKMGFHVPLISMHWDV